MKNLSYCLRNNNTLTEENISLDKENESLNSSTSYLNSSIHTFKNQVIAQNNEIANLSNSVIFFKNQTQHQCETIAKLQKEAGENTTAILRATIENLTNTIVEHEETIENCNRKIKNQAKQLADQTNKFNSQKKQLNRFKNLNKKNTKEIEKMKKEKEEKDEIIDGIMERTSVMEAQIIQIDELKSEIHNKDQEIESQKCLLREVREKADDSSMSLSFGKMFQKKQAEIFSINNAISQAFKNKKIPKGFFKETDRKGIKNPQSLILELNSKISALEKLSEELQDHPIQDSPATEELISQIEKIRSYFECPISLENIEAPKICPSGVTIDSKSYKKLVEGKMKDPFSGEDLRKKPIANRFMAAVIEILDNLPKTSNYEETKEDISG